MVVMIVMVACPRLRCCGGFGESAGSESQQAARQQYGKNDGAGIFPDRVVVCHQRMQLWHALRGNCPLNEQPEAHAERGGRGGPARELGWSRLATEP